MLTACTRTDVKDVTYFLIAVTLRLRYALKRSLWIAYHFTAVLVVSLAVLLTSTNNVAQVNASNIKAHLTTSRSGGEDNKDIPKHCNRLC